MMLPEKHILLFYTKPPEGATLEMVFFARMQEGEIIRKTENKYKVDKHWTTILNQFPKVKARTDDSLRNFGLQILFEKSPTGSTKVLGCTTSNSKGGSTSQRAIDKALKSQLKAKQDGLKTTVEKYTEVKEW